MPQVRAIARVNPCFRDGDGQTTGPVAEVAFQDNRIFVVCIVIGFPISIAPVFGQDVVAGNTKYSISTVDEFRHVGGTLEDYFQTRHTPNTRQVLTWIASTDF